MPIIDATVLQVTIANGASLSGAAAINRGTLVGIILPTFTLASLSFQVSEDGVSFREAFDESNTAIAVAASVGDRYVAAPTSLQGAAVLKIRSGTAAVPVVQLADRVVALIVK